MQVLEYPGVLVCPAAEMGLATSYEIEMGDRKRGKWRLVDHGCRAPLVLREKLKATVSYLKSYAGVVGRLCAGSLTSPLAVNAFRRSCTFESRQGGNGR